MGRIVRISVLLVSYLLAADQTKAQNQQLTGEARSELSAGVELDEIEVKGQRVSISRGELARVVRLITRKEIDRSSYSTVTELLEQEAGLDIRQRGPDGAQADISIQGSTFEQVLVLVNGIPLNNPQTGHFTGYIPVPLEIIHHIEIIRGGASRWLGPQAFAGAIHIVTKEHAEQQLMVSAGAGQHKLFAATALWGLGKHKQHLLNASWTGHAGYTQNTDLKSLQLFYAGSAGTDSARWQFQAAGSARAFGAQAFYTPVYPNQYERVASTFASAGYTRKNRVSSSHQVYLKADADEFHLFRYSHPEWYGGPNRHLSTAGGWLNSFWWENRLGQLSAGADYRYEHLFSTNLGSVQKPVRVPIWSEALPLQAVRQYLSLYAEQQVRYGRITLVAGLMGSLLHDKRLLGGWYPGLDVRYTLNETGMLYFSLNRSMRYPTFTELYYDSPTNAGNPDLLPESAVNVQLAASFLYPKSSWKMEAFVHISEQAIDWVRYPEENRWTARNISAITRSGVQTEWHWQPSDQVLWRKLALHLGYAFHRVSIGEQGYDSKYVLDHLRNKAVAGLTVPLPFDAVIRLDMRYLDREGTYLDWDEAGNSMTVAYEPVFLSDIRIDVPYKTAIYTFVVQNLLNKPYVDIGHVIQPGRWIRIGIRLNLIR